jgi:UDP:flavonoid glycosyltransferase YjiC (YdhE family)
MRVLFASTQGAGHFNPLVPFIDAALRRGHEVLVAGPSGLTPTVEKTGYPFWECADPLEEEVRPVWDRTPTVSPEEANVLVVREIFARFDARAMMPRLQEAFEEWKPDLVLRDPNEYSSAVAADLYGVPHARVGINLAAVEEDALDIAAGAVDELRTSAGLSGDHDGERIRQSPYLTVFPESLEYPGEASPPHVLRFRDPSASEVSEPLPNLWWGREGPLVHITFGSVAAAMPQAARVFPIAIEAAADLPARVLLTVGRRGDPSAFDPLPPNVRVKQWVPHAAVVAVADVVVCHGGSGTVLGTLAAGLPQVVVPLFADQPYNAERVTAIGAGLAVAPRADSIRAAVTHLLDQGSFREASQRVAREMAGLPSTDAAFVALAASAV